VSTGTECGKPQDVPVPVPFTAPALSARTA